MSEAFGRPTDHVAVDATSAADELSLEQLVALWERELRGGPEG